MRLIDYLNQARADEVITEYRREYEPDDWATVEAYARFLWLMRRSAENPDEKRIEVRSISWFDGYVDRVSYDVSGLKPGDDQRYAIWADDWGAIKLREVDAPPDLSLDQVLCHIYYELSWGGWPDERDWGDER